MDEVVGGAAVVGLSGGQCPADALDEGRVVGLEEAVLPLLGREVGIEVLELLGTDEAEVTVERDLELGVVPLELVQGAADGGGDAADDLVQVGLRALLGFDDLLPVPLVDVDGVEVVELLVAPDRVHVADDALADVEVVALEGVALPLGQRLHDLGIVPHGRHVEADGALDAVQVVVHARGGIDDERRRHAHEVECRTELGEKDVFDALDRSLGVVERELRLVGLGYDGQGSSFVRRSCVVGHSTPRAP